MPDELSEAPTPDMMRYLHTLADGEWRDFDAFRDSRVSTWLASLQRRGFIERQSIGYTHTCRITDTGRAALKARARAPVPPEGAGG